MKITEMEKLYNELMAYLQDHAEDLGISSIDEDWGQLEALLNGEDTYPVTFPCLLISFGETQWSDLQSAAARQRGEMRITTRLAFDCWDDTHAGSEQQCYGAVRHHVAGELHNLLQGKRPESVNGASALSRAASRTISLPHGIKVYETDYRLRLSD